MRRLIAVLIFLIPVFGGPFLISDREFTNQDFTLEDMTRFFKAPALEKNRLTEDQRIFIFETARKYGLNLVMLFSQIEKESSLIFNRSGFDYDLRERRALGYACWIVKQDRDGKPYRPFEGFYIQIENGARRLREVFDAWTPGRPIDLLSMEGRIVPANAASFSLYVYTPFFGEAIAFGHKTIGNRRFLTVYYKTSKLWKAINAN